MLVHWAHSATPHSTHPLCAAPARLRACVRHTPPRPCLQPLVSMRTIYKVHLNFPGIYTLEAGALALRKAVINRCRQQLCGLPPLTTTRQEYLALQEHVDAAQVRCCVCAAAHCVCGAMAPCASIVPVGLPTALSAAGTTRAARVAGRVASAAGVRAAAAGCWGRRLPPRAGAA